MEMHSKIRVGFLSVDPALPALLSPVLGTDFVFERISDPDLADAMDVNGRFDVLLMDFDSISPSAQQWANRLEGSACTSSLPVVLLADDEKRRRALALVERGAHGYVRKPPV